MTKIFKAEQVKTIDQYTIDNEPIASIDLMERAAGKCTNWITRNFERKHTFKIFCGPGNNGGDGLAIARQLVAVDYDVEVYMLSINGKLTADCKANLNLLQKQNLTIIKELSDKSDFPQINKSEIIVDALFGSGLTRPLEEIALELVQYLNKQQAIKIAIDIPSGLSGEGIAETNTAFTANYTLTFEFPFLSFLLPENELFAGDWYVLEIGLHQKIKKETQTPYKLIERDDLNLNRRPAFGHKGTFGHALIIAGSEGMAGAAVLASKAALRTGCGLLTVHSPKSNISIIQTAIPEAIVSSDSNEQFISQLPELIKISAIAIGPGMRVNNTTKAVISQLIETAQQPLIIDADALNIISENKNLLEKLPANTILTPHPGEFDRLFGKSENSYQRLVLQQEMAQKYKVIIVLKGRFTSIALPDGTCFFNSTGNNGMATAGSGDTLTGIIVSLLAQGYTPKDAALTGVYIHGLAGDLALAEQSHESLIASDITNYLGKAFKKLTI